jgi:hypothetical protein
VEPSTVFDFNGPEMVWQIDERDRFGRVLAHESVPGGARDSGGYERIVVAAPGGESVQLLCPTSPVVVMDELVVRLWVKASRPDIRLAARIALPRTVRDGSPSPTRLTLRGESYERAGHWQELVLQNVSRQLDKQVRILRSESEAEIDPREAFVDAIVLIVPGDGQGVEVATDELVVDGVVQRTSGDIRMASFPVADVTRPAGGPQPVPANVRRLPESNETASASGEAFAVRLHGDLLLVNDRPFLPRAIEYQGEPLESVTDHGFNVAWLNRSPSSEESAAARKLDLWFIGQPPPPDAIRRDGLGDVDDRVIAWLLADSAMESDADYANRWAKLVRERDIVAGRPVIVSSDDDGNMAGKSADVVLMQRPRLGFIPRSEFDDWLARQTAFARPGMPQWSCVPSQLEPAAGRQISLLSSAPGSIPPHVELPQLESLIEAASTHGIRGFMFRSNTPLSASDELTRVRAINLELINRWLQRLEPWLAAGSVFGRIPSTDAAWQGIVLSVDRARLLIPIGNAAPLNAIPTSVRGDVSFVVPGVPDSCQVYLFTPVALKVLPVQRIAGGMRIALRPNDDTFVLMTEDPRIVQSLRQHISRYGGHVVGLLRERAALKAAATANSAKRLTQSGIDCSASAQTIASAAAQLQEANVARASHRVEQAYEAAAAANRTLDQARAELRRTVAAPAALDNHPLATSDAHLADLAAFERARPTYQFGDNLLYGGDFEDIGQLTQIGWRHFQDQAPGVESLAELSAAEPRHGSYCLMLQAVSSGEARPAPDVTTVWIESAPIPLTEGQIVEIAGWVRVDPRAGDHGERLYITDSVGGADLASAIRQTNGWEYFRIIRAIPEATELKLRFALSGLGTAKLDAVMVRPLQLPVGRRLPDLSASSGATGEPTPPATGPLFFAPQSN